MKKKLLLIALPALMVLSGCSNALVEQPVKNNDANIMQEDNLAHEELFGGVQLAPKKLGVPDVDPGSDPSWTKAPKIGVQFKSYQKAETDYYAVRYVAAIADTDGMTATWSRGVSEKDSNQIKAMSSDHVSSAKYDQLNNGSTPVDATSEGTGYQKYIVYTMYDIPASQDESYIAAYLTLSKDGEEDVVSKVVAAQLDGSHYFSFNQSALLKHGYFLQSSTAGIITQKAEADTDPNNNEIDNALFENVTFAGAEEYGLFRFTPARFQFFGYSTFMSGTSASFIQAGDSDQYCKMRIAGQYSLFVNKDNLVYTQPKDVDVTFNFTPSENWKQAGAVFYLYGFNDSGDPGWYKFSETGEAGVYSVRVEHWSFTKLIYVRKNPENDDGSWTGKWNQSSDINVNFGSLSYTMESGEWW